MELMSYSKNMIEREGITHFDEAGKSHIEDFHELMKNYK